MPHAFVAPVLDYEYSVANASSSSREITGISLLRQTGKQTGM